jgi:DNA primase
MPPSTDPVQEIKQRIDILDVVSEYVKLRQAGKRHVGLCPFHSEKTPSFSVSPDQQAWYCFGCSEGGDLFSFVQKIENLSFRETLERLAKRAGVTPPEKGTGPSASERERLRALHELACRFYERTLSQTPAAQKYLQARGIPPPSPREGGRPHGGEERRRRDASEEQQEGTLR